MKIPAFALALLFPAFALAQAETPPVVDEPVQFRHVVPAQPVAVPPGRIEVLEFFWYGCPHCYAAEPHLAEWLENKPAEVSFRRIPVTLNRGWEVLARAYYTAEALDVLDRVHPALFAALHEQQRTLNTVDELAAFFAEVADVDEAAFRQAYASLEVASRVQQADVIARRYAVRSVPAMAVNGSYMTDPELAGGYAAMVEVVQALVRKEHEATPDSNGK